jgi:anhydro-N-acetylmuramic acid kinase
MKDDYYNVIGVMSGTSLDGIDVAHIQFHKNSNKWNFEILENETFPYSNEWVNILQSALGFTEVELKKTNYDYTKHLASVISSFIKKHKIENLDAVCSHGHTILHQPEKGITLQIGNLPEISSLTHQMVICDFRVQDVLLGGQGAPLVPIGDRILFPEYDYCMNLGGFSNISYEEKGKRIAFDISPLNTVLNFYANQLGLDYDDKGSISRSGQINHNLLDELNKLHYYQRKHPKSLGLEFVKETILPLVENFKINTEDKLRTFTEHAAMQIALALPNKKGRIFITGGGAYNNFFIERTQKYLPEITIIIPEAKILEFKEALIFALLGVLKLREENNVLSSVTGATADHCSGIIYSLK